MLERRIDPDELLKHVQTVEEREKRGKLKIFLGASAGVGKTFAMLSEAHEQKDRGVDVVVGYVETHGRKETDALMAGLEQLPLRDIEYKGVTLKEFNLDAALKRHPQLILVDELAHTNAPDSRHPRRFLDVEELLRSGIDVYTAINIQHLESLNDVVAQITGIPVRETVPDSIFEEAEDVELVDIPPKELIQRLKEGKVYVPHQIEHAIEGFFREGNLIALRELALRRTADRVDAQMQFYRTEQAISKLWPTRERILVCIAPNEMSVRLVRAAKRMSESLHADVICLYVESDRQADRPAAYRARVHEAMGLAEELGMETVSLSSHNIVSEVLRYAQRRNVTQVIVGKPVKPKWQELLFGSVVSELVRSSGDINVHVISGEGETGKAPISIKFEKPSNWKSYAFTLLVVAVATALCFALDIILGGRFERVNMVMVYLLGVAFVSSRYGPQESLAYSFSSVLAFDFFFVPPRFSFSVSDTQYVFTFCVMFGVALLISTLTQRMRAQADSASRRERRTAALYTLSKQLARSRTKVEIATATCASVLEVIDADVAVLMPDDGKKLSKVASDCAEFDPLNLDVGVADWAYDHGEEAGISTDTLPGSKALYLPLKGTRGAVGVLVVKPNDDIREIEATQMDMLRALANQTALALERTQLAKETHMARLEVEGERLRNSLLSSVSHDLRTPLTSITGAASTLLEGKASGEQQKALLSTIYDESERLNRLVRNLLDMTRLESGELKLNLEWQSPEELVGSAVRRTERSLANHKLLVAVAPDLPLLKIDGVLIEQVLINLLENAARHTPPGTTVEIKAQKSGGFVRFEVEDTGPGIERGEEAGIFEKFQRGKRALGEGFGLGLAICRGILKAHNSQIWGRNRPEGGALFVFELQAPEKAPAVQLDE